MNQHTHSRASLFLMELMLNILFFSVLITICVQFLFKAHTLADSATTLHRAATTCSSLAEIYQSGINGKETLLIVYPDAILLNENLLIYFDKDFISCTEKECHYRAFISFSDDELQTASITFSLNSSSDEIFHLEVAGYRPQPRSELAGGGYK